MRVAIIGCGKIAQIRHIPEYLANEDAELAGYYDFNLERAEGLADEFGGKAYESVESLLEDETVDAVSVCAANNAHAEITIAALKAGKHVLCEKPMATKLEDCEAMVKTAKECGRYLMIGQNQRLAKAHVKAKELLKQGLIGDVITFRTSFGHGGPETWSIDPGKASWFFDKKKAAMGAMADLGVHKTDLIQFLLDSTVKETTAKVTTLNKRDAGGNLIGVDDNAVCIYVMDNGVVGTMTASWTYYGEEDNSTILYGTDGIMKIYDDPKYSIVVTRKNGEKIMYDIDQIQTNDNQTKSGIIDAFVEAVTAGKKPSIDGESVLTAMKAVFASIQSSDEGKTIEIK
ncbi:MAG: Gfo/Idh/MocA family oxidoreductase [Lachnospiraceae bacterium]|jgi:predicted dehydrogenase|nr:Gfo/Idh/MocA family oxidoreductase [Lachnospiraceae bacterium]MDD3617574.1 Gfo/Idh/MocA family oxidoreductase [Lachnospiraceae bacterium]